jgi:protein-L-isoaspartate(D-aspartate) O-methyltransferase
MESTFLKLSAAWALVPAIAASCWGWVSKNSEDGLDDDARQTKLRHWMVKSQIAARGLNNPRVLDAMRAVPRHRFVPANLHDHAYEDRALPIGEGQTISQPFIVALMTHLADPKPSDRALDVGTGCGYQAALLSRLVEVVHSIEIVPELVVQARARLREMGYQNVDVSEGDGTRGLPQYAPYDVILLAAAPAEVPQALIEQLAPGGRLILPVGAEHEAQQLLHIIKHKNGAIEQKSVAMVSFVPMTGEARGGEREPAG